MILDEQHDLDKAKESVYILQRGLFKISNFYVSRGFSPFFSFKVLLLFLNFN